MNLKGRKFLSKNGKVCTVKDTFENITIFDDNTRVDTRILFDTKYFNEIPQGPQTNSSFSPQAERVDPNQFFNQRNVLLEQINAIPNDVLSKLPMDNNGRPSDVNVNYVGNDFYPRDNSSAVVAYDAQSEAEEIARKYQNIMTNNAAQTNSLNNSFKSNQHISKLLEEEGVVLPEYQTQQHQPPPQTTVNVVAPSYEEGRPVMQQPNFDNAYNPNFNDPVITMFKKAKMNTDFKISIDIQKKIPRLDFIEMMEDSYETSIIEYLADEFTDNILRNPSMIKNKIVAELRSMLENSSSKKKTKKAENQKPVIEDKKVEDAKKVAIKKTTARRTSTPKAKTENNNIPE